MKSGIRKGTLLEYFDVVNGGRDRRKTFVDVVPARSAGVLFTVLLLFVQTVEVIGAEQTQTVNLVVGWNAVWLEVEPRIGSDDEAGQPMAVEDVFTDSAIAVVARLEEPIGTAEFISAANETDFNQEEWAVWRRSSELGLNTLTRIRGNNAYLIQVTGTSDVTVDVTGDVRFFTPDWIPDSYNFVGFSLLNPVSFDDFFGASAGRHPANRIFRMQSDSNWVAVSGVDLMTPREAYFVFADGPSNYSGPVAVAFAGSTGLNFGAGPGAVELPDPQGSGGETILVTLEELVLTNISDSARTVSLVKVEPATTAGDALNDHLRLYEVTPEPDSLSYAIGANGQVVDMAVGDIAANSTRIVTLGAHRAWSSGASERENLYRIEIDNHYFWLPATAENPDLAPEATETADPSYKGLWIGEVILNEVSSLTEPGSPVQSTTSAAPMRVILHVNESGNPSLLSHVMFMQTKTADDSVPPAEVLVVDEQKIPFFEGIEERGGKIVGRRIESVGYDMPRKIDPATQAELREDIVALDPNDAIAVVDDVTAEDIAGFINSRTSRPVDLVDEYHRAWPLHGGLGPGQMVRTTEPFDDLNGNGAVDTGETFTDLNENGVRDESPLLLDPFHRSNPFRHAFHPSHGAGFAIQRAMTITFDDDYEAGLLKGTYEESVSGLAASPLATRGRITLQRVSDVGELQ